MGPSPTGPPNPKLPSHKRNKGLNKALFRDKQVANNPLFFTLISAAGGSFYGG